ncbi:MAG: TetR/AcrR family transcriptional regulator [Bacteroidia bacterium]
MPTTLVHPLSNRKEEILQEAQALFSAKGYSSASMRVLAEKLDIKPASLYSNFKSKEIMLWEIALRCAQAFFEKVEPIAEKALSPKQKLESMLDAHIDVIIENQDVSAIFFEEWKHLEGTHLADFKALRERYENLFIDVIKAGKKSGAFNSFPNRFLTHTLFASVNWVSRWYKPNGEMTVKEVKQTTKNILFGGLLI